MSDQWQLPQQVAMLRERVSVLETTIALLRSDLDRRMNQLSEGQDANRTFMDGKLSDLTAAINTFGPTRASSDRIFVGVLIIGAIVSAVLILLILYWVNSMTGGRLT